MIWPSMMKFILGEIAITGAALRAIPAEEIYRGIDRHVCGDWGNVTESERDKNEFSLQHGFRLVSVYETGSGVKFRITTDARRTKTTVLLPHETIIR